MAGENDLAVLLKSLRPRLREGVYVFAAASAVGLGAGVEPILSFREDEGAALILRQDEAERLNLSYEFPCRWITLDVHSALVAVGMMAVVTARLSEAGISVNPVSALRHDHLFVPAERAAETLEILRTL